MKIAIIIMNRDRADLADAVFEQVSAMAPEVQKSIVLIEAGSKRPGGCAKNMTHWFEDEPYRGRYHAFDRGLQIAREEHGDHDFYWFVCNDVTFPEGEDTLTELLDCMAENPRMALIGPSESNQEWYPGAASQEALRWHKAATVHGLAQLIRGEVIHDIGYMNPAFHYSQGAGAEYAYKLYRAGWFLAYSDRCSLTHDTSGSTYGKVTKISRHEYQRRANLFASRYFVKNYGKDWDKSFAESLPEDLDGSAFAWHRKVWEKKLDREFFLPLPLRKAGSKMKSLFKFLR